MPPTTSIDPYTGKAVTAQEGYHVKNASIQLTIKNQHFAPYTDSQGNSIILSYNVSIKGSYSNDWKYYYRIPLSPAKGEYTLITFCSGSSYNESDWYNIRFEVPSSGKIDFRVEALIGYCNETVTPFPISGGLWHSYEFIGESSGWSNIQTLNLDNNSATTASSTETVKPSQNSEPTSTEPVSHAGLLFGFDWQITALIATVVGVVAVTFGLMFWQKRKQNV